MVIYVFCRVDIGTGEDKAYTSLTLSELQRVGTLGMGGFGRVELVNIDIVFQTCIDLFISLCYHLQYTYILSILSTSFQVYKDVLKIAPSLYICKSTTECICILRLVHIRMSKQ